MNIALIIVGIILVVLFAIMSVILLTGRGGFLISGYNWLSEKEKQRYDEKKLCRATGVMLSFITISTAALFLCLAKNVFILPCIIGFPVLVLISVAFAMYYTNNKCYKINYNSDVVIGLKDIHASPEYIKQKRKKMLFLFCSLGFSVLVVAAVIFIIIRSARPTEYIIQNGTLQISTAFGESITLSDIEKVQLKNNMPTNISKDNGLDLGTILKGEFEADSDKLHVYVDTTKPPFIYIYTKDGLTIANAQSKAETQALYKKLR